MTAAGTLASTVLSPGIGRAARADTEKPWQALLGQSLTREMDYAPRIEGRIPPALQGSLYRNGPGLFERAGHRKQHLLDGDGMIQAFDIADGRARYRNRFVRTEKFREETEAGRYLNATWTTRAPGGMLANLGGGSIKSQAGVTVLVKNGELLALDEVGRPYRLDRQKLETLGMEVFPERNAAPGLKAHTKTDPETGNWTMIATEMGRSMTLHIILRAADGRILNHHRIPSPRVTYLHDFFETPRYLLLSLHAVDFSALSFLSGNDSFTDALSWSPGMGNILMLVDKQDPDNPIHFDAPASYMWHSLNAYEAGEEIIADFVGYEDPDHFIGPDPTFKTIMQGKLTAARHAGYLQRYVLSPRTGQLRVEQLDEAPTEFPVLNPRVAGRKNRFGFMSTSNGDNIYHNGLAAIDLQRMDAQRFFFGRDYHVGEPVFAADPDDRSGAENAGWLMAMVLDGARGHSMLSILDARNLGAGSVANLHLSHPTPLSFHGCWQPAQG